MCVAMRFLLIWFYQTTSSTIDAKDTQFYLCSVIPSLSLSFIPSKYVFLQFLFNIIHFMKQSTDKKRYKLVFILCPLLCYRTVFFESTAFSLFCCWRCCTHRLPYFHPLFILFWMLSHLCRICAEYTQIPQQTARQRRP